MKSYSLAGYLQRLWNLIWRKNKEGGDVHEVATISAERGVEEESSSGLPLVELKALFGQSVQAFGQETARTNGIGYSPPAMNWSEVNIRKLIDAFGIRVLNERNEQGITFVHLALMGGHLECAKLLFDYAAEQGAYVSLRWKNGDILGWSIDNKSRSLTEFVLQRMSEQCSVPEETAVCLSDHFEELVRQFPRVMQNYIMNDKFCFEYGRFDVPQSLFADRPNAPIAVLGAAPSSWRPAEGSNEVKGFWEQKGLSDFTHVDGTSDRKVSAVSKVLCVDLSKINGHQMIVRSLLSANYPVDVFRTQSVKNFVQWRWIVRVRGDAVIKILFNVLASALLFLFVAVVWDRRPEHSDSDKTLASMVFLAFIIAKFRSVVDRRFVARLQFGMIFYVLCFFFISYRVENTAKHLQFATSLLCILCLFVLMEDLRPFDLTGPFISMIGYVLTDIRPFIVLGTLMIIAFGTAFRVLFADHADGDAESFRTLWLSFESMFHATLGEFEPEVFNSSPASLFSIWRSLLFNLFLFLAAIVLSLLIAVLGDTCDRVILAREAETIKSRAFCLSGWTLKELSRHTIERRCTGEPQRILQFFLDVWYSVAPVFTTIIIFVVPLAAVVFAVYAIQHGGYFGVVLFMLVAGLIIVSLLERDIFFERIFVRDPLLLRLNSNSADLRLSVFWFLVPATSSTPSFGIFWEGRLIAMSRLVSERLKKAEQNQERDTANLEDRIIRLEASLQHQMRGMQDRLAGIEASLEKITHTTP